VRGHRAAHHHDPRHALGQRRVELERQRDIGQRPERDQQQAAGVLVREAQDRVGGVLCFGLAARRLIADVAESILAVDVSLHRAPHAAAGRRSRRTDRSSTPATSHSFSALATVWRRPTLPAAMVRPTTS
jgi:hypothetical protein